MQVQILVFKTSSTFSKRSYPGSGTPHKTSCNRRTLASEQKIPDPVGTQIGSPGPGGRMLGAARDPHPP